MNGYNADISQTREYDSPGMKRFLRVSMWISAACALTWFVLDLIFHRTFFVNSAHLTVWMQTNYTGGFYYFAWTWFDIPKELWVYWPFIVCYVYPNRALGLKTFTVLLFANWCKNFLKLLYLDDRPNLEFSDILPFACKCEYGKPSGTLYNATSILMCFVWDLYGRRVTASTWSRILALLVGFVATLCVIWSIIWMGSHAYNQMFLSMLLALTQFFIAIAFEDQLINFWEVIINKGTNFKKYVITSLSICLVLSIMYLIPLFVNWNAMDYSRYLTHGSCPQCSKANFSAGTYTDFTRSLQLPMIIIVLASTNHVYTYNRRWILDHINLKGIIRLAIAVICWLPMFLKNIPKAHGQNEIMVSELIRESSSSILLFAVAPYVLNCFNLGIKGDIARPGAIENLDYEQPQDYLQLGDNNKI